MRKYGLLGKSLAHSFSKSFFDHYFAQNVINATFENKEITSIEQFPSLYKEGFSGLTITIPYKEQIIPFLDELSPEAREIGAVNVIQYKEGKKIGHNTDAYGFQQSIKPFLTNKHERAMVLGTGGAAKAVTHVFKSLGINVVSISRNPKGANQFPYEAINNHMINACKVIVNCTPVGTFPAIDECIDFPFQFLTNEHLVIDLIYNPAKTMFLKKAEEKGATILNGESMLKQQALRAWEIWNE